MIKRFDVSDFRDEFRAYGRGNNFSYKGFEVLFDFLEGINPDMELDVIGIDYEFYEYTIEELDEDYGYMMDKSKDEYVNVEEYYSDLLDMAEERTIVLQVPSEDTYIIQAF